MSFIDAGAGTGKTARLVRRIVRLVLDGDCTVEEIAAITFTERAAAELRDRVRVALANAVAGRRIDNVTDDPQGDLPEGPLAVERATEALGHFHRAPISTLHAFAQRLIMANLEAVGLPETVEIVDDLAQAERFDRRWITISNRLLTDTDTDTDTDTLGEALDRSVGLGVDLARWREIAEELDGEWDRCRTWLAQRTAPAPITPVPVGNVIAAFNTVLADAQNMIAAGVDDKLAAKIVDEIPHRLAMLESVDLDDGFALCHALVSSLFGGRRVGTTKNWSDIDATRARADQARSVLGRVANEAFLPLLAFVANAAVESAEERRRSGLITFHDVLVLTRDLVKGNSVARVRCRQQYRYLLVDEFQDTDPLQAEIALALSFAGDADLVDIADAAPLPDGQFELESNRLVFVGDPKQSIYRFRRADVGVYMAMKNRFTDRLEVLDRSFRSRAGIVDWTNNVFAELFDPGSGQVDFQNLTATRVEPLKPLAGPGAMAFGGPVDPKTDGDLKALESEGIAAIVAEALASWEVIDNSGDKSDDWRDPDRRVARPADVAVLLRTRSLLPQLTRALTKRGIPFRFEGRGLAWESQEIADVVVVLGALDDPADPAKIVAALRSRSIGASDDQLLAWKQAGGRFTIGSASHDLDPSRRGALEKTMFGPVPAGLAWMWSLYRRRFEMSVPATVRAVIRDCSLDVIALDSPRPRDAWARLQLVVDTADQFATANSTATLRQFLARCVHASEQGATSSDRVVAEPDDNVVRILTIHAAKGLEFPVAIVAGLGQATRHGGLHLRWSTNGLGEAEPIMKLSVKLGDDWEDVDVRDLSYKTVADADTDADGLETERLAYVACTRARDHLAVSLFHAQLSKTSADDGRRRIGHDLHAVVNAVKNESIRPVPRLEPRPDLQAPVATGAQGSSNDLDEWRTERRRTIETEPLRPELRTGSPSTSHTPTSTAIPPMPTGDATVPPDRQVPAWVGDPTLSRRLGSAVHQVAELMQPDDTVARLDDLATAAAAQFAVVDVGTVRAAVEGLRGSASWQRASTATRCWRELPMDGTINGTAMAAIADLVWELPNGELAVADWKTHSGSKEELRDQYTGQLDAYRQLLEAATGLKVRERIIVAVHPRTGAVTEVALGPAITPS